MRSEQDVIDQLADYFGWLETQLEVPSVVAPSPVNTDNHDRPSRRMHAVVNQRSERLPVVFGSVRRVEQTSRRPVAVAAGLIVAAAVAVTSWLISRPEPAATTVSAASTVAATVPPTSSPVTSSPSTTSDSSAPAATSLPDLPIDPNELVAQTPEQSSTLSHGIGVAIRTCMAKAGFDYHLQKVFVFPAAPRILDEAWRRQYGYGFPRIDTSDPAWDTWITTAQKDPAFMPALQGPDPNAQMGGCTEVAYSQIYPPNKVAVSPQNETFNKELAAFIIRTYGPADQRFTKVLDPEMENARLAWSTCMKVVGVDAVYPGELESKLLNARPSLRDDEGVTQAEITVALQDWQCEVSTGFLQHWYGRLQQLTAAFASEHADMVAEIRQWNTDATARAQRVIDANP